MRSFTSLFVATSTLIACESAFAVNPAANDRDRSFDSGWRFLRADGYSNTLTDVLR